MPKTIEQQLAAWDPAPPEPAVQAAGRPEARQLLHRILSSPVPPAVRPGRALRPTPARRWKAGLAAVTTGALLVAAALVLRPGPRPRPAAPDMHLVAFAAAPNGDVQAVITDPQAAASQLSAVFRAHGFNIAITVLPVSPSLVGTIVFEGDQGNSRIRPLQAGSCYPGGSDQCWIGLLIPAHFSGKANLAVGRAARPGETYESSALSFGPGEALHCTGLLNQPLAEALPVLAAKGLTPRWDTPNPSGYVVGGTPLSSTRILLQLAPRPLTSAQFRNVMAALNRGC